MEFTDAVRMRIYCGESDKAGGRPLYEEIVLRARRAGLAGATVMRGPMGYGLRSVVHTAKVLRLSEDLPIVVELIDSPPSIERFIDDCGSLLSNVLVTLDSVRASRRTAPSA